MDKTTANARSEDDASLATRTQEVNATSLAVDDQQRASAQIENTSRSKTESETPRHADDAAHESNTVPKESEESIEQQRAARATAEESSPEGAKDQTSGEAECLSTPSGQDASPPRNGGDSVEGQSVTASRCVEKLTGSARVPHVADSVSEAGDGTLTSSPSPPTKESKSGAASTDPPSTPSSPSSNAPVARDLPASSRVAPAAAATTTVAAVPATSAQNQSDVFRVAASGAAEAAIRKWKENKDYLRLQRDLGKTLSTMERTPLADWSTQAALLSQLQKVLQSFKDVIGAVELPDGDRFAKTLWRALSPQNVVGVQRKALEVVQTYLDYVNPAYPMTKDVPNFLPCLLELLPQASMQVKGDILELLDRSVVRRMPPGALRSCAQGLFTALLSCLEESETSPMYRRAMALLEYMHGTLQHEDVVSSSSSSALAAARASTSTSIFAAELRGGQVLPAYSWIVIRDAAGMRPPAFNVVKWFIAQENSYTAMVESALMQDGQTQHTARLEEEDEDGDGASLVLEQTMQTPRSQTGPAEPNWVGGDLRAVVAALLNSLQDTQEKTHRLALDVLALICPLGGSGDADYAHVAATALSYENVAGMSPAPSPTTLSTPSSRLTTAQKTRGDFPTGDAAAMGSSQLPVALSGTTSGDRFSFETKAMLVAAAVQLLGTRYGTPSVARRIFQWLTVDPSFDAGDTASGDGPQVDNAMPGGVMAAQASSSGSYVQNVSSYILSQGFHMVVEHWAAEWAACGSAATAERSVGDGAAELQRQREATAELSALQHTARLLMYNTQPRLSTASSVAAALTATKATGVSPSSGEVSGTGARGGAARSAAASLASPLVWLRALLVLFRYRSSSSSSATSGSAGDGQGGGAAASSPTTIDSPRRTVCEGTTEAGGVYPFLQHVVPLVLPSLSRLLVDVPRVLGDLATGTRYPFSATSRLPVAGAAGLLSEEQEIWATEVRELLRVLPWTAFVRLDEVNLHAVEKLIRPALVSSNLSPTIADASIVEPETDVPQHHLSSHEHHHHHLQRRVCQCTDQAFTLACAVEAPLMDATADQPLAAQEYVRASLDWSDEVAALLHEVIASLAEVGKKCGSEAKMSTPQQPPSITALLISAANGLLRLLVQRMQQLMEPMLDAVLATATATGNAVVGADFFSSFLSSVDTRVLHQLRSAATHLTTALLLNGEAAPPNSADNGDVCCYNCSIELQRLLYRMHHTTLRFTSFLTQLHLRCQQQAVMGVLLDSASDDGAGSRERELARQTTAWLTCLCEAATAAATTGATLFFARAVRLVLDVLLRARGSLLPEAAYAVLEPCCPSAGDGTETAAFAEHFVLAPVVRSLWNGCSGANTMTLSTPPAAAAASASAFSSSDAAAMCVESLLVLVAVSPPAARCLDLCLLSTPIDAAVQRLVRLHRELTRMRAQQRRGQLSSAAVADTASLAELHDPGVLFLGTLTILDCVSGGPFFGVGGASNARGEAAESTRQLARAYVAQALVRDLPGMVMPLFFSFLCPLVLPTSEAGARTALGNSSASGGNGAASSLHGASNPPFSAVPLTVLLPSGRHRERSNASSPSTLPSVPSPPPRTYRTLEAAELVQYIFALLQLSTAPEWVRLAMQLPTPNSLRVLLRALEAQSFMAPETKGGGGSYNTSSSPRQSCASSSSPSSAPACAPAHEGPSDTLFAATALLLLNLSRQSLLSLHWSCMRRRDEAAQGGRVGDSPHHRGSSAQQHHRSTLLDSLACLNRLLELSQTGPRVQPQRTAVLAWQFTSMQLLPLLRLAVQADLTAVQAMLLDHLRSAVLYLDDVGMTTAGAAAPRKSSGSTASVEEGGCASRHWRHHALLRVGVAAAGQTSVLIAGGLSSSSSSTPGGTQNADAAAADSAPCNLPGDVKESASPILNDLKRAPAAVLSNKLLYAMINEVVEHVLGSIFVDGYGGAKDEEDNTADLTSVTSEIDTLVLWLRFYCDLMPYLYRDLVSSAEIVMDVLLSALEPLTVRPVDGSHSSAASPATRAHLCGVCYTTLTYILQFLSGVAGAADRENYESAMKTKESMSWIASTFSQDDPVAQARNSTLWARSPVLTTIQGFLPRLVSAAMQSLLSSGTISNTAGNKQNLESPVMWGYDPVEDDELSMGWKGRSLTSKPPAALTGAASDVQEHARCLLRFLYRSAGPQFLTAFLEHWCGLHAAKSAALWMFETVAERQTRVERQRKVFVHSAKESELGGQDAESKHSADATIRLASWEAKDAAQRAAAVLWEDTAVPIAEVTAVLSPLLRDATEKQQRVDQQQQQQQQSKGEAANSSVAAAGKDCIFAARPPPRVTQMLYFLDQLVESCCVGRRQGGLTDQEAEAVLSATAEVVSHGPPNTLSFCCILHTLYCVVAYAASEPTAASGSPPAAAGAGLITAIRVFQSRDYAFTLCRLLEGLTLDPAAAQRSATLLLLQLLCQTCYAVLPSSLGVIDNPGRLVDGATRVFQRSLLPILRRGIASVSEAEILSYAPLVNASLRVLRATISGFAPDLAFEKRVQRDLLTLFFSEHFFRYSRSALHEWALLLRLMASMDHEFHNLLCERMVPSPGRLSAMMMSRETEALLRERSLKSLGFYTFALLSVDDGTAAASGGSSAGATLLTRYKELIHLLREQLTYTLQHFSSPATPTALHIQRKEVFVQPLRAAFFVFRVLLICNARESLVASLWPLMWPELLRALSISPAAGVSAADGGDTDSSSSPSSAASAEALQEVLRLQMEALKVLDVDYTLYPAHALAFRWLFTDDAAITNLVALQQQQRHYRTRSAKNLPHRPSPLSVLLRSSAVRRLPLVSHLEVLRVLTSTPPLASDVHLSRAEAVTAVHELRAAEQSGERDDDALAPVLHAIQRCWPTCARPPAGDTGLRRPLYNIPCMHYPRLDGIARAAQAYTVFLQRLNSEVLPREASAELHEVHALRKVQSALGHCVGYHNEVDVAFMQDLVEADLTLTDPDTML